MDLTNRELNLIRQWCNSVQDLGPDYLEEEDYRLQVKVLRSLNRRVPHDVLRALGFPCLMVLRN
jgi:hypothetical protein